MKDKLDSRALDRFLTSDSAVQFCLDLLNKQNWDNIDLWLEPSAGEGAFLRYLPTPRIGLDISPSNNSEIIQKDFLQWSPHTKSTIAVVGNPPFGKNSSLAVKFFNHSATFADCIAMILPRTFRKDSIVNRLDRNFHLKAETTMPNESYEFEGESYSVPTVFQIWSRKSKKRDLNLPSKSHAHFSFVDKNTGDFAVQRVGVNAGRVKLDMDSISPNSHYFLKEIVKGVLPIFKRIDWSDVKYETAGNPSISKAELVNQYTKEANSHAI